MYVFVIVNGSKLNQECTEGSPVISQSGLIIGFYKQTIVAGVFPFKQLLGFLILEDISGRLSKRGWKSHSLLLFTKILVYRTCTVQRPCFLFCFVFLTGSRSGYSSGLTNAACAPPLAFNGKTTCRTKKSSREPACPA